MKHGVAASRHARQVGFTLLELLIALTLVGLMMTMLAAGLSFGARVWDRGDQQLESLAQLQIVQQLIRRQLLAILPPVEVPAADGRDDRLFRHGMVGDPDSVVFSTPALAQADLGGIYRIGLHMAESPKGKQLVLSWQLSRTGKEDPRLGDGVSHVVLLDELDDVVITYGDTGADGADMAWHDRWETAEALPTLLRLDLSFVPSDRRRWPRFLVALKAR